MIFLYKRNKKKHNMYVIKRSGEKETVQFDKITNRLNKLLYNGLDK